MNIQLQNSQDPIIQISGGVFKNYKKHPQSQSLNLSVDNTTPHPTPLSQKRYIDNFKLSEKLSLLNELLSALEYRQYNQEDEAKIL